MVNMSNSIKNAFFRFVYDSKSGNSIGSIQIKDESRWIPSISEISIRKGRKRLEILSYSDVSRSSDSFQISVIMTNQMEFLLKWKEDSPIIYIIPKSHQTIRNYDINLDIAVNFYNTNQYDYLNLSGNKYQKISSPQSFSLKVPPTGAFAQTWTIHSKKFYCGIVGLNQPQIQNFDVKISEKNILISQKIRANAMANFCIIAGYGEYYSPIKEKLINILPIKPLSINYTEDLKTEAKLSFNTLYDNFLLKSTNGKSPGNFIFYKTDENGTISYHVAPYTTIGNCFSLGYITGTKTLHAWTKDKKYLEILINELLPPLLKGALVQSGKVKGAYFDTYNQKLGYWTTGRIQDPKGGFTDWFPVKRDKKGSKISWIIPPVKQQLSRGLRFFLAEKVYIIKISRGNPALFKKYDDLVVSPPYSGQIAYNLFQVLSEMPNFSSNIDSLSGTVKELYSSIESTVEFLIKYQREDGLWDQELTVKGEIFWNRKTLACIYPAALLFWWGHVFGNNKALKAGETALAGCLNLLKDGEYYGVYFETDAANNQGDLVTAIACIKCFSRIYELTKEDTWLDNARAAAWHLLTYMWGTGVIDSGNNEITGGMPVTTYKSMGFPVIGGSELCQAIEGLLELSMWDGSFLVYAKAGLGFHSHYMYFQHKNDRATHEIIWGMQENWSTTTTVDFASYATGPFIRSLYLYEKILKLENSISN